MMDEAKQWLPKVRGSINAGRRQVSFLKTKIVSSIWKKMI
jgi:hypothetical protein